MDRICYDKRFIDRLIKNSSDYYAHLPKDGERRKPETLSEHSGLTYAYTQSLIESLSLRPVLSRLINLSIPPSLSKEADYITREVETLFMQSIAFHDLGKVNHKFQQIKMKNAVPCLKVSHDFKSEHSSISMYIFLAFYYSRTASLNDPDLQDYLDAVAVFFSYSIHQHHSTSLYNAQETSIWNDEKLFKLSSYLPLFNINLADIDCFHEYLLKQSADLFKAYNKLFKEYNRPTPQSSVALYALLKLNYSLLTACDYLATAHYMNDWKEMISDFGVIDDAMKDRLIKNASSYKYNKTIYENLQLPCLDKDQLHEASDSNLNLLRQRLAIEVIQNIRAHSDKHLFYLEAPTGSGKTNVSLLAATELLASDESLNKIFYVFPFTTLITQTYKTIRDTLSLDESEMVEIHSKAFFKTEKHEEDYKNYLENLFVNYPIVLLSHIKFFDIIKTNDKELNYLFHRLANSVVVIDEMQSYLPSTWNAISYFIVNYAKILNIKFVIMSATLPKIGDVVSREEFVYLLSDKKQYFLNPNFCNRVKYDYSLLSMDKPHDADEKAHYLQQLKSILLDKSSHYAASNVVYPNSVHVIIEFIYKKTASDFYALFADNTFFDEIFLLSGTILEPRRRDIIHKLKSNEYREKKILLISTQVVEAGVDIDMDLGFKDKSLIDSEEQLAGRINRNVKKKSCMLYLFDCDRAVSIYGTDERYKLMNEMDFKYYQMIIENKDFDDLYQKVIEKIIRNNQSKYTENINSLEQDIQRLNFSRINGDLKLIDSDSISVFVPLKLDIDYFKDHIDTLNDLSIPYDESVDGRDVWYRYESLIFNQDEDFVHSRINMKKIQGIMSYYIFSIFPRGKDFELLHTYGEEKYGFLYLENFQDVYSLDNGINTDVLSNSMFI